MIKLIDDMSSIIGAHRDADYEESVYSARVREGHAIRALKPLIESSQTRGDLFAGLKEKEKKARLERRLMEAKWRENQKILRRKGAFAPVRDVYFGHDIWIRV